MSSERQGRQHGRKDRIICGDAKQVLSTLPANSVDLTVTSPPYFRHRDYGVNGQLGREATVEDYIKNIRGVLESCSGSRPRQALASSWLATPTKSRNCFSCPTASPCGGRDRLDGAQRLDLEQTRSPAGKPAKPMAFSARACSVPHETAWEVHVSCGRHQGALRRRHEEAMGQRSGVRRAKERRTAEEKASRMRHGKTFKLNPKGCLPTDVWSLPAGDSSAPPLRHVP